MSGWFGTEDSILPKFNSSCPSTNPDSSDGNLHELIEPANVTFHGQDSAHNLAEWIRHLSNHFCEVGHQQFYKEILSHDILCSYPEEKMAEMQEKARTVLSLFRDIASEIGKTDKMLEFIPYIAGSCNEGTKVLAPDEMDMLCVLHKFQHLTFCHGGPCPSFVIIVNSSGKYHPFCRQDNTMDQTLVF